MFRILILLPLSLAVEGAALSPSVLFTSIPNSVGASAILQVGKPCAATLNSLSASKNADQRKWLKRFNLSWCVNVSCPEGLIKCFLPPIFFKANRFIPAPGVTGVGSISYSGQNPFFNKRCTGPTCSSPCSGYACPGSPSQANKFIPAFGQTGVGGSISYAGQNPFFNKGCTSPTCSPCSGSACPGSPSQGASAGGAYSSGGSNANANSVASAGSGANAGSYISGQDSNSKAASMSQSGSRRFLQDSASTASSSSMAYSFGNNNAGDKQVGTAVAGARAANVLGEKGAGLANDGSLALAMSNVASDGVSTSLHSNTAVKVGKENIGTNVDLETSSDPNKPRSKPNIQIYGFES